MLYRLNQAHSSNLTQEKQASTFTDFAEKLQPDNTGPGAQDFESHVQLYMQVLFSVSPSPKI